MRTKAFPKYDAFMGYYLIVIEYFRVFSVFSSPFSFFSYEFLKVCVLVRVSIKAFR
jgi:hypothetical protein